MNKYFKFTFIFILFIISTTLLVLAARGQSSPSYYRSTIGTEVSWPFESSNSKSRFALTKAVVENHDLTFDESLARFSAPDIVQYNNKFFSVFLPGISFLGVPFYYLGSLIGQPEQITYLLNVLISLISSSLVIKLARKLGAGFYASCVAGFIYLFATNIFPYAHTFTQHPVTAMLLLLGTLNIFGNRTLIKNIWFGIILSAAIIVDIPNILILLPLTLFVVVKNIEREDKKDSIILSIKLSLIAIFISMLPVLGLFAWYNYELTGSFVKIGQSLHRSNFPSPEVQVNVNEKKMAYDTRNTLNGLYILLISHERGIIYYEPVVLIGILGFVWLYRKKRNNEIPLVAISSILITLLSYSMFDDPWGGWSFGPRYLIPAIALLCVFIGPGLRYIRKYPILLILCALLTIYSIYVNTLGAFTTSSIPPKIEAEKLIPPKPYTYEYNLGLLRENGSSSSMYNLYFSKYISAKEFLNYFVSIASFIAIVMFALIYLSKTEEESYEA